MKPIACKYNGLTLDVPLFILEEPLPDHPAGSTVSEETINRNGRFILYPVAEIEMLRKICDDRREIDYILSSVANARVFLEGASHTNSGSHPNIARADTLLGQIVRQHQK